MDAYSSYFQPGYASPYKLWHDTLRRRANRLAGNMQARAQNAYALSSQFPQLSLSYNYGAGYQGGQGNELQRVMGNAIADVLISLGQPYSQAEGPTTQCQVTVDMLYALQDGYAAGTVGVPVELVAAGPESSMQYAAAYKQIAALMIENQRQFATPDPYVSEFAKELATDPESEITDPLPAEAPKTTDGGAASPSTQPARPGLSVLQSAKDTISEPLKSMATVPTIASSTITIGSGTDAIDHFDVRNLGIKGVESVKVMHPLQQADLAKHQTMMLFDLFRSLVARINRGRYGPPGRPDFEAVATSTRVLHAELQRRKMSVPDRVPIPSAQDAWQEQYAARSSSYVGQSSRMPSTPQVTSTYFSERKVIGSGGFNEPFVLKSDFEGELSHPLTPNDLPAGLEERDILELKAMIEHKNRRTQIDELVDRAVASRYRARKESVAALDVWLAREQAAKDSFAEGVAEGPELSSDTEKQPRDAGAEAESSGTAKSQRGVSFAQQGSGGSSPKQWARAGSYFTSTSNSRAPSSRSVSNGLYIPTGVPRIRMPRPILRSGSQSTIGGQAAVSKDSSDVEASEVEELHGKSGEVAESSTDKASNATDDGSDIGSFGDVKSDSAESGPSVHELQGADGLKDGEKTPIGKSED
ncbi:hypothetical protein LTR02_002677 [Friedmanniomyces endolithicus]|nr:hypothetical protein LTR94_017011 [Friedmanniomyces endolithicus]KAK0779731.1 hypothetical protein LTR38_014314 [Friedmanniomyces endolithicus]KAK0783792.1 hypothetical protein LTR75_014019 [Friedmanniomyces endolithicus]KAK0836926.1 hypothetical protein LTR03_013214 [Friedmanniomyces endolithicus]KAK0849006.1 hypothetical protein LTS02_013768 [Friedmanniomyces endolithicus]